MVDMSSAIIAKSDQLNSDDLIGAGKTIKITKVSVLMKGEQPVTVNFEGDNGKPYKPSKGMCRVMVQAWGIDPETYVGRSLTLFRNPDVTWAGAKVGGIQISHMSDIKEGFTMALTASKGNKKPFTVKPLTATAEKTADPAVIEAGNVASSLGVQAYTTWKDSLPPDVKSLIRPYHAAWSEKSKLADKIEEVI